jgi:hypothetical protein
MTTSRHEVEQWRAVAQLAAPHIAAAQAAARVVAPRVAVGQAAARVVAIPQRAAIGTVARVVAPIMERFRMMLGSLAKRFQEMFAPLTKGLQKLAKSVVPLAKHFRPFAAAGERMAHQLAQAVAPSFLKAIGLVRRRIQSLLPILGRGPGGIFRFAYSLLERFDATLGRVEKCVRDRYTREQAQQSRAADVSNAHLRRTEASRRLRSPVLPLAASITRHAPPRPSLEGRTETASQAA